MKKITLVSVLAIITFSCSKNSEQLGIVKKDIERNLSEIEKKDINYNCVEISDREAYQEIIRYDLKKLEAANKELEDFQKEYKIGRFRTTSFDEMSTAALKRYLRMFEFNKTYSDQVEICSKRYGNDLKELSKLKGKNVYYKVEVVKLNPDTIIHRKVYLDNNNKVIFRKALK